MQREVGAVHQIAHILERERFVLPESSPLSLRLPPSLSLSPSLHHSEREREREG
jgi:hypothetical protein